jgi:hypothetical protein
MTIEKLRAFWRNEIHEWKIEGGTMSWARWCAAREINPEDMPRPLDAPPPPVKHEPTAYDLKQARRRKRAVKAITKVAKKAGK